MSEPTSPKSSPESRKPADSATPSVTPYTRGGKPYTPKPFLGRERINQMLQDGIDRANRRRPTS